MQYTFSGGQGRFLTLIKNNISFPRGSNGYVSVDPKANQVRFPAYIAQKGLATLDSTVLGGSDAVLQIHRCTAVQIPTMPQEVLQIPKLGNQALQEQPTLNSAVDP